MGENISFVILTSKSSPLAQFSCKVIGNQKKFCSVCSRDLLEKSMYKLWEMCFAKNWDFAQKRHLLIWKDAVEYAEKTTVKRCFASGRTFSPFCISFLWKGNYLIFYQTSFIAVGPKVIQDCLQSFEIFRKFIQKSQKEFRCNYF